jgi:hypothetical protein
MAEFETDVLPRVPMPYLTLPMQWTSDARSYLRRADEYRRKGNEQNAFGCERKALNKLEKSFQLRHLAGSFNG